MPISSAKPMYRDMPVNPKEPPDTLRLSFGPKSKSMPKNCSLGEKVTVAVTGVITSLQENEYGKSFEMEIKTVDKYKGGKSDAEEAKEE